MKDKHHRFDASLMVRCFNEIVRLNLNRYYCLQFHN